MNGNRCSLSRHSLARYRLSGDTSHRWWTPAGGVAATLAVVAIVGTSSPVNAIPIDSDGYGTSVLVQPTGPKPAYMRDASVLPALHESLRVPPGLRQCFIWQAHWNEALDGPQPWCPIEL